MPPTFLADLQQKFRKENQLVELEMNEDLFGITWEKKDHLW